MTGAGHVARVFVLVGMASTVDRHWRSWQAPPEQETTVDAGSFTILRGSTKIGREEFRIRRASPPGLGFLLTGTVVYPDRRMLPVLGTDSAGSPERYQVDVRIGDRRAELLSLQIGHGQGSTRVQTSRGETATEFEVPPEARLLDDSIFSQYYFLVRPLYSAGRTAVGTSVTLPVILPRRATSATMRLEVVGPDSVDAGGGRRAATRWRLSGSGDERELWADAGGRILRVVFPGVGLTAVRDDAPR